MSQGVGAFVTTSDIAAVVSAVAAVGTLLLTSGAIWIGFRQLSSWRDEARSMKRAEALIMAAVNVGDSFDFIRSPVRELDAENPDAEFEEYIGRLKQERDFFEILQQAKVAAQIRLDLAPDSPAVSATERLLTLRNSLRSSLKVAYNLRDRSPNEYRRKLYSFNSGTDEFRNEQIELFETIKKQLLSAAHLEAKENKK